jgi:hypothetical protein
MFQKLNISLKDLILIILLEIESNFGNLFPTVVPVYNAG